MLRKNKNATWSAVVFPGLTDMPGTTRPGLYRNLVFLKNWSLEMSLFANAPLLAVPDEAKWLGIRFASKQTNKHSKAF